MFITVLGSGSNGGVPQWDCCCPNCTRARETPGLRRTRSSVAISLDGGQHVLIDATPDLKQQLEAVGLTPIPEEADSGRHSRMDAVLLTHGHGDHTVGIAEFSTGKSFEIPVYGPPDLIRLLFGSPGRSSFFGDLGRLARNYVSPRNLEEGERLGLLDGLTATGFEVAHTDRLEDGTYFPSSTFGYELEAEGRRFVYTPDLGLLSDSLLNRVQEADLFMLDATFWWDDELARMSGLRKTSYDLGHVPVEESLETLKGLDVGRVVYTHLNHTNPLQDPEEKMMEIVRAAGFEIAHDGMTIVL
jgi:pyrroloquinoline quinone biosynthesis protein B